MIGGGGRRSLFEEGRGNPKTVLSRKLTWKPKKGPMKTTVLLKFKRGLYGFLC